jgi:hypothetical protein
MIKFHVLRRSLTEEVFIEETIVLANIVARKKRTMNYPWIILSLVVRAAKLIGKTLLLLVLTVIPKKLAERQSKLV